MAQSTQESSHNAAPRVSSRRKRQFKLAAIAIAAVLIAVWLAFWLYHRLTHVSENDARVTAHVITVSSRLPGRVIGFNLIEGDRLAQGDRIAQLNSTPDKLQLDQINAHIADIKAQLRLARQQIAGGVKSAEATLAADTAAMHAARSRMEKAHDNYARAEKLYKSHSGSEQQRDIYRYDYQSARADLQKAQSRIKQDRVAVDNARTGLLTAGRITNPDVLATQLKQARAKQAHQQNTIDDLTVKSPIQGVVDKTFIQEDQYVSAGQPIVMMHDPGDVWITANLKETEIGDLAVGQPVDIHVDARPDTRYTGHVQVIGSAATNQFALLPNPNPSGNFTKITQRIPVRIAIDHGPRTKLAPGMMVEVDIDITGSGTTHKRAQQTPIKTRAEQRPPDDAGDGPDAARPHKGQ